MSSVSASSDSRRSRSASRAGGWRWRLGGSTGSVPRSTRGSGPCGRPCCGAGRVWTRCGSCSPGDEDREAARLTPEDIQLIERALEITLPDAYKRVVSPYPIGVLRGNADTHIWDNAERIVELNRELRV